MIRRKRTSKVNIEDLKIVGLLQKDPLEIFPIDFFVLN